MKNHRRSSVLWIVLLFIGGPLASWVFITHFSNLHPLGRSNHGALIQPIRPVPTLELIDTQSTRIGAEQFKGRWTLLILAGDHCAAACQRALHIMRQVQIAQGLENHTRLRYTMLINRAAQAQTFTELQSQHPRLSLCAYTDDTGREGVLNWLSNGTESTDSDAGGPIFVVDPLGNLMLRFDPTANPRGLIQDLARLLALSSIG